MSEASVIYQVADGVASLTLNRPQLLNALDTELAAALADHADRAASDRDVVAVIVRGYPPLARRP